MATGEHEEDVLESRTPRDVSLVKGSKGFGFNIRGQVSEGGKMRPINGQLYPPLQYISAVVEGGPAAEAEVKPGDRLLAVNDVNVEGVEHQRVVDLIRSSGKKVKLTLVSVTKEEANRLEMESVPTVDVTDMRSVPLSIPDFEKKHGPDGKEYVVRALPACLPPQLVAVTLCVEGLVCAVVHSRRGGPPIGQPLRTQPHTPRLYEALTLWVPPWVPPPPAIPAMLCTARTHHPFLNALHCTHTPPIP